MLKDKVIIVTGGASGIGRAASKIMAAAGATIIVADRDAAGAQETAEAVAAAGGVAVSCVVDVGNEDSVAAMVQFTEERFGRLDGAFNNAGVQQNNYVVDELPTEEWSRVFKINSDGVFYCMKHEIALMRKTGGGAIVNTASVLGVMGTTKGAEYIASKHAVVGATRGAACDARETGVRVNAILPGAINTPMIDELYQNPDFKVFYDKVLERLTIGRWGTPEDCGYAAKWLLSDESSYINGTVVAVDGGYSSH